MIDPLAIWLDARKDKLITLSVQGLSGQEMLREASEGPVRWFFDNLIQVISGGQHEPLESLLRNWVAMCSVPINGQMIGLLPVLGVFKRAIWHEFQLDPPVENSLALAARLDSVISSAAEFLSRIEAAGLLDTMSHQVIASKTSPEALVEGVKDSFISVAAHELKTPLTVIEGYTNMLKCELPEAQHPRATQMLEGIENGLGRMRELVEDLIDVSLLEIDLFSLEMQPVWLRSVLEIAETEIRKNAKSRRLTFEFQHDTLPADPTIADPERLLKALMKVLVNAVKYTPDGGK